MAWRDSLRPAKLGNASFFVESSDATIGRNTQVHEYPLRDVPFVEDLGRKARRVTFEAYVIGADYMTARDALIAEIEAPGSKTLVHPYLGELKVTVVDVTGPKESTREGGLARFSIAVVETGEQQFPRATVNTAKNVTEKAANSSELIQTSFVRKFNPTSSPTFILDDAVAQVESIVATIKLAVSRVASNPDSLAVFLAGVDALSGDAASLVSDPVKLAARIVSLVNEIASLGATPEYSYAAARGLFHYGSDLAFIPLTTSNRIIQAQNQAAVRSLVRHAVAIVACSVSASIQFKSEQDALITRDELIQTIDEQLEQVDDFELDFPISDEEYFALVDVRTAMVNDLESRGARLAQLVPMTLIESTSAIVVAYDRYSDVYRDQEIIDRNLISDPLFMPSGRTIQVLSDA
jgi:prophage DNA circulation protein